MSDNSSSPTPGGRNLLLQTGGDGGCEESACMELLGLEDPAGVDVLFVTFTKSADDRLETLKRHADAPPARVGVVSVQVGGSNGGDRVGGAGGPTVRRISDPSDLTGVGIAISEFLSAWSGDGNRTVVCFESLTALLQYVDASRVFQFCNEITSKFERAGATAHFHITPEAHERQELSVLSSLFDGRVGAADLGSAAGATSSSPSSGGAGTPETDPGAADAPDDSSGDAPDVPEATGETEDPFEYAGDDGAADPAEDVASTDVDESTAAGAAEPEDGTDSQPDAEPADLVSSVIAGDSDGDDKHSDGDGAADPEGGPPDDAPEAADAADAADDEADDPTEGATADGDLPETEDDAHPERADESRPAATARQAEHEARRRRLQYVGPDDSSPAGGAGDDGGDDPPRADRAAGSDDPTDGGDTYAFYQRTTATVVGVVVMLVLISFLSAAMPVPVTPDDAADGADVSSTATPEEVAAANESATETATATEDASTPTPTPTATATPTPTPDSSTGSSSSGSSDDGTTGDDGSTGNDGSTSDPTATPTSTPTATATATPSDDDLIDDTLDTTDELL